MATMGFCGKCKDWQYIYNIKNRTCSHCGSELVSTDMSDIYWSKIDEEKRQEYTRKMIAQTGCQTDMPAGNEGVLSAFDYESRFSYASGKNRPYVVLQVTLKEKFIGTGSGNLEDLEEVINRQVAKGYRLHTMSTAAGGSLGIAGGDRIQATLVFERLDIYRNALPGVNEAD